MAEGNGTAEHLAKIATVDKLYSSPSERASHVWEILQQHAGNLSTWDVLCFCVEYIGLQVAAFEWLKGPAIHISRLVYHAHYYFPEHVNAAESGVPRKAAEPQHPSRDERTESETKRNGPFAARFDFR